MKASEPSLSPAEALAAAAIPLAGPSSVIKAKAIFAPERPPIKLASGGVLDLTPKSESIAATFAEVSRNEEALDLLRKLWIEQLLPMLGAITQMFWVESQPLVDPTWTERFLRELHARQPGLRIAVISAAPEPDQRRPSEPLTCTLFTRLRSEGLLNAVIYLDPLSRFALNHSQKVQTAAFMNALGGLLISPTQDPSAPSVVEAMTRLGSAGDVTFAYAAKPTGTGRRRLLPQLLRRSKGDGDVGELVIQSEAAAAEATTPVASAWAGVSVDKARPAFYIVEAPMDGRDTRRQQVEEQVRPSIGTNLGHNAIVLVAAYAGFRLPGIVGPYVTSAGIFFNFQQPNLVTARQNGDRSGKAELQAQPRIRAHS